MCGNHDYLLNSTDMRDGYVKPYGQGWRKVRYANVGGKAIFEGCIVLGKTSDLEKSRVAMERQLAQHGDLLGDKHFETEGLVISGGQYRWKNRTIPYFLPTNFPNPDRVKQAIAHWHDKSTIRFVPWKNEIDYINFVSADDGCASEVGRRGGMQEVMLRPECERGHIIHELGHTVGLWHEQSREDRDTYLEILYDNILPGTEANFDQHILDGDDVGPYDYASIMHYSRTSFTANDEDTMRPRKPLPPGVNMGQRDGLSRGDIATVEKLYAGIALPPGVAPIAVGG
jgi:hypothetical protein